MSALGSARVSRAGFGVAPKQSFLGFPIGTGEERVPNESSRSRGRATQMRDRRLLGAFFRGGGWVLRPRRGQRQGNDDPN
jgi:hypothetical protein